MPPPGAVQCHVGGWRMSMNGFCRKEEGKAERDSQDGRDEMGKGRKEVK